MGALLQGFAMLIFPPLYAVIIPALVLLLRFNKTVFMSLKLIRNEQMDGVIPGKFSAQLPNRHGVFSSNVADQEVALIILAARSNQ